MKFPFTVSTSTRIKENVRIHRKGIANETCRVNAEFLCPLLAQNCCFILEISFNAEKETIAWRKLKERGTIEFATIMNEVISHERVAVSTLDA